MMAREHLSRGEEQKEWRRKRKKLFVDHRNLNEKQKDKKRRIITAEYL
jgi:hypothetical protein